MQIFLLHSGALQLLLVAVLACTSRVEVYRCFRGFTMAVLVSVLAGMFLIRGGGLRLGDVLGPPSIPGEVVG